MKTLIYYLLLLIIFLPGCKSDDNPVTPPTENEGKIVTSIATELITKDIGPSGGTIIIEKAGDKLNGMQIIFPPNALTQTHIFKVTSAEIESHRFGEFFNPISPAITVSSGADYTDLPVQIEIPINIPADNFAMGFFYNPETEELEGIPIEGLDSNSITMSTRTFSSSGSLQKIFKPGQVPSSLTMIICSVSESVLREQAVINSGFSIGFDDWEFINFGSYVAPEGHCAGQSMTAMWYYYEKHLKGEPTLFHRYDKVNDKLNPGLLWQDNPLGYRFASVIQNDFNFNNWIKSLDFRKQYPRLVFLAFAVSILLTGEPQFVLINNSGGNGGHAMIVYKVNFNEGKLYIADPNYPNNRAANGVESVRTINFVNGAFDSYWTGLNAGAGSIQMDEIGYFAKTAFIKWNQITSRWNEFENKSIGKSFPPYELKVFNDNNRDLTEVYYTGKDNLKIYCRCATAAQWLPGSDRYMYVQLFDESGNKISNPADENNGLPILPLKMGVNKFGVYMQAGINGNWNYLDFKWITTNRCSLKIQPDTLTGEINLPQTFTANTFGTAPEGYKIVWNFGDDTPAVTTSDSTVTHIYTVKKRYTVTAKMYTKDNVLLAEASSLAIILSPGWNWPYVSFIIRNISANVELYSPSYESYDTIPWSNLTFSTRTCRGEVEGNVFTALLDTAFDYGTYVSHDSVSIKITINPTTYGVVNFEIVQSSLYDGEFDHWKVTGSAVPLYWMSETSLVNQLLSGVKSRISKLEWEKNENIGEWQERRYKLLEITGDDIASIEIYWSSELTP